MKRSFMERVQQWCSHRRIVLIAVLVGMGLTLPSLGFGLLMDDYLHYTVLKGVSQGAELFESRWHIFNFVDTDSTHSQKLIDYGILPWWTSETLKLKFWRPVTVATHVLDYELWPDAPMLMHAQSILWYGLCIAMIGLLYRRLMGATWIAGLAVLMYAMDDAHSIPAGWLANRNTLVAGAFGFAVIWAHDKWRKDGLNAYAVVAWVMLLVGLLAKEATLSVCAYLFAYALFLDKGRFVTRFMTLVPYGLVVVGWRIVYSGLGYGAIGSDTYVDPVHNPIIFAKAVFMRMPPMLFDQMLVSTSEPFMFLPPHLQWVHWGIGVVGCVVVGWVLWRKIGQDPMAQFFAVGMVLALIPSCATFPSSRLLFFSGLGGLGLIALYLGRVMEEREGGKKVRAIWGKVFFLLHGLLAPFAYVGRMLLFAGLGLLMQNTIATAPLDIEGLEEKTVIGLNAPNIFYTSYIPLMRDAVGKSVPKDVRSFAPLNPLPVPIHLEREDEDTMVARPDGGYPWYLARSMDDPFAVGDVVTLPGLDIEVREVNKQGRPMVAAFHFAYSLDDDRYVWLHFEANVFYRWDMIGVGDKVRVHAGGIEVE